MRTATTSPLRGVPTPLGGEGAGREGGAATRIGTTKTEGDMIGGRGTTIGTAPRGTAEAREAAAIGAVGAPGTTASGITPPGAGDTTSYRDRRETRTPDPKNMLSLSDQHTPIAIF